ncbi:hypothetical protein S7711_00694 [Stachybotrys chartarum IBT 7711]|uniref:Monopolin complex subunit Csm1/Pcs1 C-terminal domain-containing protein n=1 Tax=Stachybotrys chartarum (strain CBS 109288 / IBT 7711) TaxID=1280523 RepID=A0A084AZX0_STACB|nr:hypothetical protein S7711_00694 [Stachybotrys chartarum IBT 7711]
MPRQPKATARLAGLADSDSEPDFDSFEPMVSGAALGAKPTAATTKPARGRPRAANRVTKPAPKATRKPSGRTDSTVQSPARQALADKSNLNASRARKGAAAQEKPDAEDNNQPQSQQIRRTRGRPKTTAVRDTAPSNTVTDSVSKPKRGRPARQGNDQLSEIPETQQPEDMDLDVPQEDSTVAESWTRSVTEPNVSDWACAVDLDDVSLRRKLGDLTRRHENLEMRHRDLREIGVKEAERNYERLKKQAEESAAASNSLIAHLKDELAAQRVLAKQADQVQAALEVSQNNAADLENKVSELTTALDKARAEIKTLSTRLAASRATEAAMKAPGSALKNGGAGNRNPPSEVVQAAQAREDLYGDLTGLIVRGFKRDKTEDVFDCIQTGRNGTLHFKLALDTLEASDSYEDVQFTYRPQLKEDRDGDLLDVLPDYLVEEITFPRTQASKFYSRVVKSLTERVES